MSRKSKKQKPKTFIVGRLVFIAVSVMVGAVGILGWWLGHGDIWQRLPFAGLAAASALVIPVCAGQLGRNKTSLVFIAPMLVFMGWSAYSLEHANETLVEAPRKAAHTLSQASILAEVEATKARVVTLQAKRDALTPEVITCQPCLNTRAQADKRFTDALDRADKDIAAAAQTVKTVEAKVTPYQSLVSWEYVLAFGGVLDLVIALALFGLESSARKELRDYEARNAADKKAKAKARVKPKAKPLVPASVVTPAEELELLRLRGAHLQVVR